MNGGRLHFHPDWEIESLTGLKSTSLDPGSGRGRVRTLVHPKGILLERQYRHGGMRRWFLPTLFFRSQRAQQEYETHLKAFQGGVNTPRPVGWREFPMGFFLARHYFYTCYLDDACPLPQWLQKGGSGGSLLPSMVETLFTLYQLRIQHGDLNLNNWLISGDRPLIIDFDKAGKASTNPVDYVTACTGRMARSGKKLGLLNKKRLFFRFVCLLAKRWRLSPRRILQYLPSHYSHIRPVDRWRWKISGGHQADNRS